MSSNPLDDITGVFGSVAVVSIIGLIALFVTPFALLGIIAYIAYRLYRDSPARAERLAHDETMALYHHAKAGRVRLSEAEIETALTSAWPSGLPASLRSQLLDIGFQLFEAEGLTPDIPPPPALCNTIEGARYRDMIAKSGQAGNDRNMSLSALAVISEALGVITRQVPTVDGDVTVPITQFINRPGEAVGDVIAPFFSDNDYNHFKTLKVSVVRFFGAKGCLN